METFCPNGHRVDVLAGQVGMEIRCPTCQQPFTVTSATDAPGSTATRTGESRVYSGQPADRVAAPVGPSPTTSRDRKADDWNIDVLETLRPFGQVFLLVGLLLAMLARGWDAVGDRHAAGAQARIQNEMSEWNDTWADRFDVLDQEERSLRAKENLTAADRDRLDELAAERRELEQEREADRQRQVSRFDELEREARQTEAQNQLVEPWREGLFMFGSILFAVGLLAVGFTTEGPVRWFCLVLLAIIILSMYLGSPEWFETARSASRQT